MFRTEIAENIKTHISYLITFFFLIMPLSDNVEKYYRAGQATDDNMAHAHCLLDTKGYKRALRICDTYCFSTATVVARTLQTVTLYRTLFVFF